MRRRSDNLSSVNNKAEQPMAIPQAAAGSSTDSTTTTTINTSSPASLLWAHQLRREHKALVSRFTSFESSTRDHELSIKRLNTQIDEINKVLLELKGDVGLLKSCVENIEKKGEEVAKSHHEAQRKTEEEQGLWKRKIEMRREEEEGGFHKEIKALKDEINELKNGILEIGEPLACHRLS